MGRYNDELKHAGVLVDLAGLLPSAEGRRVKFSGGSRAVIEQCILYSLEDAMLGAPWLLQLSSPKFRFRLDETPSISTQ